MISGLSIAGFRCFEQFTLSGLGRVNLLLGKNNCGKTALLEAVQIVASAGTEYRSLWSSLFRRGETFPVDREGEADEEFEAGHLFTGHEPDLGSEFAIEATSDKGPLRVRCTLASVESAPRSLFDERQVPGTMGLGWPLAMRVETSASNEPTVLPLTSRGGLTWDVIRRVPPASAPENVSRTTFISTESLSAGQAQMYWNEVALNPEEHLVLEALRLLEPRIERIGNVGLPRRFRYSPAMRGGMALKMVGSDRRIPMGSMGDGMWRILAMALSLVRSRDGILLVDEIDTGLHHTVMADVWRMVIQTCRNLNVQVFATTHSNDCVRSLAGVCPCAPRGDVSVQRIELGRPTAVAFTEAQLEIAAKHDIEIR